MSMREHWCFGENGADLLVLFKKLILIESHKIGIFILIAQMKKLKICETIACSKLYKWNIIELR